MDNQCTLRNSIVLAICAAKIDKFGGDLMKFWQKQVEPFLGTPCHSSALSFRILFGFSV